MQQAIDELHAHIHEDFTDNPDPIPDWDADDAPAEGIVLATEVASEPETSNAAYYGAGAAAFSAIAAAAYLYRKRQSTKGTSDEFQRV